MDVFIQNELSINQILMVLTHSAFHNKYICPRMLNWDKRRLPPEMETPHEAVVLKTNLDLICLCLSR